MKFKVTYLVIDKNDNHNRRDEVVEAGTSKEVLSKIKKDNKGCILREVSIRKVAEDTPAVEKPTSDKKCEKCGKLMTDFGQCPVCDLGDEEEREGHTVFEGNKALKEARDAAIHAQVDKKADEGSREEPEAVSVEQFWGMVCSGEDEEILKICRENRDPNTNYNRFGREHSYIMGAIRNGNYSTAKLLLSFGHRLLDDESYEVVTRLIDTMEKR